MNARLTSFDVSYGHTLPSDAGRQLDEQNRTVDLRSVTVETVVNTDGNDRHGFELKYTMGHEERCLTLATVEPQYNDDAPAAALSRAAELSDDAVHAWLKDIDKDLNLKNTLSDPGVRAAADVFTVLEVDSE